MSESKNLQHLDLPKLHFDSENPRFAKLNPSEDPIQDEANIIQKMLDEERVIDLVISIADQGYFAGEPLLVFKSGEFYVVAEGNRRLAALKILSGQYSNLLRPSVQEIVENATHKPKSIPCIVFNDRGDILHFLGYRHITGVKSWGALEKAIYLQQLKDDLRRHDETLTDAELHRKLAREIGSNSSAVAKSLTALALYRRGFMHTSGNFFGLQLVTPEQIQFSLIYTALGYTNLVEFLNLESSSDVNLNQLNEQHAKELFGWIFAENEIGYRVIADSRQLKQLNQIVGSPQAIEVFKQAKDLKIAYSFSNGLEHAFLDYCKNTTKLITHFRLLLDEDIEVKEEFLKKLDKFSDDFDGLHRDYKRQFKKQMDKE